MRAPLVRGISSLSQRASSRSLSEALRRGAPIDVHPEVQDALQFNKPVVALETTIVTHGMPQPTNLTTARSVESIVRAQGAIPATIGFIGGRVKIGLESHELERLADVQNNKGVVKVSRRDIGPVVALGKDGGTTCSSTLIFAALAGIKVFATGGLGGVHRGGENTMDVSADLQELTRCPVGLVSAGVKSILDIGRTLEYLETLGVPVATYGKTDEFPAFYTGHSGFKSPWRVNDPSTAAKMLHAHWQLGFDTGAIFAAPIPDSYEVIGQKIQESVEQALREADENGVSKRGKEATPWLLNRVGELTSGKSLASNVALIENTAAIGGQIAVAYSKMVAGETGTIENDKSQPAIPAHLPPTSTPVVSPSVVTAEPSQLVVVGSAAVDITARAAAVDASLSIHSTSPGNVALSLGGVGRNVAEAAHRVTAKPHAVQLISAIGMDSFGRLMHDEMVRIGMRTDGLVEVPSARTAVCNMVLDGKGDLVSGVADMDVVDELKGDIVLEQLRKQKPSLVAVDANLSTKTLSAIVQHCNNESLPVFFEPTSVIKSTKILPAIASALKFSSSYQSPITFASPNLAELANIYEQAGGDNYALTSHPSWWETLDAFGLSSTWRMDLDRLARLPASESDTSKGKLDFLVERGVAQMAIRLLPFFKNLVIKCGERGVIVALRLSGDKATSSGWAREARSNPRNRFVLAHGRDELVVLKHYPSLVIPEGSAINVTGAGDSLVGALLADLSVKPDTFADPEQLDCAIGRAQAAAVLALQSSLAVSPELHTLGKI